MKSQWNLNIATLAALLLIASFALAGTAMAAGEEGASEKSETKKSAKAEPAINAGWEFSRANRLASAGAITRSIPHYEKVLKAAPDRYKQAYFNLAEVYRFKGQCKKSVLLYGIYISRVSSAENRADAEKARAECLKGQETGTLTVSVEPAAVSEILIDGYAAAALDGVKELTLLSGDYSVDVRADEHLPQTAKLAIKAGEQTEHAVALEKMLFFGTLKINVEQKGATIKIEPKKLDSKQASTQSHTVKTPMAEPLKLATGKYFVEITAPDFNRWIRNVDIRRDQPTDVDVTLTPALPEAIRPR